jgi:uncharacterized protein YjbI with pentapeptide repeats
MTQPLLFKILDRDARARYGDRPQYPVPYLNTPGTWTPNIENPRLGTRGYHLTTDPNHEAAGREGPQRIFLAEYTGSIDVDRRRVAAESVRLVREITPDWELLPAYPEIRALLVSQWRKEFGTKANLPAWANLYSANLTDAYLRWANLTGVHLRGADLRGADLIGANLSGAHLSEANLLEADLREAKLTGTNFTGADLRWANLSGAILTATILTEANLTEAKLSEADLSGVILAGVNLTGVNLTGADLSSAKMTKEQVRSLNLSEKQKAQVTIVEPRHERGVV